MEIKDEKNDFKRQKTNLIKKPNNTLCNYSIPFFKKVNQLYRFLLELN